MSILLMDGFDLYNNTTDLGLRYTGTSMQFSTTAGRWGGGAFQLGSVGQIYMSAALPLELWAGFALQTASTSSNDTLICSFTSVTGLEASLIYNAVTGVLKAYAGRDNTLLGSVTLSFSLADNQYHWIDWHYKYSTSSAGISEVWIDNTQVLNLTGVNSGFNSGQTALSAFVIGSVTVNTPPGYVDDVVLTDTTTGRLGNSRIETLVPTSDATPNNGTPSTGTSHFAVVDESQYNTSDYLTMTNTSGQEELFGMSDLTGTPITISAVQIIAVAENSDAGSANLATAVSSSGSTSFGSSVALSSTWKYVNTILATDPHTSAAWTTSGVNAMLAGFKVP